MNVEAGSYAGDVTIGNLNLAIIGGVGAATSGKITATGSASKTLTLTNIEVTGAGSAISGFGTVNLNSTNTVSGTVTVDAAANTVTRTVDQPVAATTLTNIQVLAVSAGSGANDFVTVSGTNGVDSFQVNTGSFPSAVGFGSANIGRVKYTAGAETVVVNGLDGNDTFNVVPDANSKITLNGGNPTTGTGDTLILSVVGVTNPLITPNPAVPNGQLASTNRATVNWTSIETFPVPLGLGGTFDFGTTAAPADLQSGFLPVTPSDSFTSGAYSSAGVGWVSAGQGAFNRLATFGAAGEPNSPQLARLLRDGEWGNAGGGANNGVFRVAVAPNQQIQVTAILGDTYASRDNQNVYVSTSISGPFTRLNPVSSTFNTVQQSFRFVSYSGMFNPGANSAIFVTIETTHGGTSAFWTISGLDVRPVGLIAPLALTRDPSLPLSTAITSDGTNIDNYTGTGAAPFAELTISPQFGTVQNSDADASVKGLQIVASASGTFTFSVKRPLTTGDSLFTITDVTGASGTGLIGPTNGGALALSNDTYNSPPVPFAYLLPTPQIQNYDPPVAVPPPPAPPVPPSPPAIVQRFDFDTATSPTLGGFTSVKSSDTYNATRGYGWSAGAQGSYNRGTGGSPTAIYQDGHWGYTSGTFAVSVVAGTSRDVRVYLGDSYTAWPGLTVNIEGNANPAATVDPSLSRFGFVTLTGTDANSNGILTITISAPTWVISAMDVATVGGLPAAVSPVAPAFPGGGLRLDFNGPNAASMTAAGFTSVRGNTLFSLGGAYGWKAAVNEFERTDASMGAMTATRKPLFRDGAWGSNSGTFVLGVQPRSTNIVRVYVGDSYTNWPGITLGIEGGSSVPTTTNATPFAGYVLTGTDVNGDGVLTVTVTGQTWVINGLDAVQSPNTLPTEPQKAGFERTTQVGTVASLTQAELQPIVAEAIKRWSAAGANAAALANVQFRIADLDGTSELGAASPGLIRIDGDAFGAGWFVDGTPGDDAEFVRTASELRGKTGDAASRVDLLTVVMHELGHELGYGDVDGTVAVGDLMAETLTPGVRRMARPPPSARSRPWESPCRARS